MKRLLLYIFLCCFTTIYNSSSSLGNHFDYYFNQFLSLSEENDIEARIYLDSCQLKSEELKSNYYSAKLSYARYLNFAKFNKDSSIICLDRAASFIQDYEDSVWYAKIQFEQGNKAIFDDDFLKGVVGLNRTLSGVSNHFDRYYDQLGDEVYLLESKCWASLGVVYNRFKDYEVGLDCFNKALKSIDILTSQEAQNFRTILIGNIGYTHAYLGNYDKAEAFSLKAIEIKNQSDKNNSNAFNFRVMGMVSFYRKDYTKALNYIEKSDEELKVHKAPQKYYDMNTFWRGKILMKQKKFEAARDILTRVIPSFNIDFTENDQADLYELIGRAHKQLGDRENCILYFEKALATRIEYENSEDRRLFDEFILFYDREQENFTNRMNILRDAEREERMKIEQRADNQKKSWIYSLFSVIIVLLSAVIFSITRSNIRSKRSNAELKDLVDQKNILFKEVHHRVKNNFQIISSLLNLQRGSAKGVQEHSMLEEAQSRIRSMALVHEMLYDRESLKEIDFKVYAEELVNSILQSIQREHSILMEIKGEGYLLDLDKAIPLGLILNEAVTNAAKHAFDGIRNPKITVILSRDENKNCGILIQDNGNGIPEDLVASKKEGALGIELIQILVEQLNGKVQIHNDLGTAVAIYFPT